MCIRDSYYSVYGGENEAVETNARKKVLVLGSGPIRIGQGIEFDYCSVHATWAFSREGYETVIVNNNPETVSTDFDIADKLYFEPLTPEDVENVVNMEHPDGAVVQFGGQTAIKLTESLMKMGVPILGTSAENVDAAEDRELFDEILEAVSCTHLDVYKRQGYYPTPIESTYQSYLDTREDIFKGRKDKFVCLMDLALMGMRKLKKEGKLQDMEESDEINACSVIVPVEMDYGDGPVTEEWLIFFKNETHNHPTEIEPFGGAATCLGGAIRDPLSGRGYVYQAMRVTGAADPTVPVADTLKGKLSQKKLVRGAADRCV